MGDGVGGGGNGFGDMSAGEDVKIHLASLTTFDSCGEYPDTATADADTHADTDRNGSADGNSDADDAAGRHTSANRLAPTDAPATATPAGLPPQPAARLMPAP